MDRKMEIIEANVPSVVDDYPEDTFSSSFSGEVSGGKPTIKSSALQAPLRATLTGRRNICAPTRSPLRLAEGPISISTVLALESEISALERSVMAPSRYSVPQALSEIHSLLQAMDDSENGKRCKKTLESLEVKMKAALKACSEASSESYLSPDSVFDAFRHLTQAQALFPSLELLTSNLQQLRLMQTCWAAALANGRLSRDTFAAATASANEASNKLEMLEKVLEDLEQKVDAFIDEAADSIDSFEMEFGGLAT
jgi:hypothetical protein